MSAITVGTKVNRRAKGVAAPLVVEEELSLGLFDLSEPLVQPQSVLEGASPIEITTPPERWAFAVLFPLRTDVLRIGERRLLLVSVEAEVTAGRVGIGYVGPDGSTFLSTEIEAASDDGLEVYDILIEPSEHSEAGWLVVRNTAEGGQRSRVLVHSVRTFRTTATRIPDLVEAELPAIPKTTSGRERSAGLSLVPARATRCFQLFLTHTSRSWDWSRCSRDFIAQRGGDPSRFRELPAFEQLAPYQSRLYSGGMTLLDVTIEGTDVSVSARRCLDSQFKIQHANFVGTRLVLCFEHFLAVLPKLTMPASDIDLRPGSPWRLDDKWFGGLHTVFPAGDDMCIVSSSGADAVLWVDLRTREVVRRWRLPGEVYGSNYNLTPEMSVVDHYVHNDIQLGHLNCACPDGMGGCYVSTLYQGDIGHIDPNGEYELLSRGNTGCHGVRVASDGRGLYFVDSCSGRLMQLQHGQHPHELWNTGSRWLHDAVQLDDELFLLCLGDTNEIAIVDVVSRRELGRFDMNERGVNVQFASVVSSPAAS